MNRAAILITLSVLYWSTTHAQTYVMRHGKKIYLTSNTHAKDPIDEMWTDKTRFRIPVHKPADFGFIGTEIPGKFNAAKALFSLFPGRGVQVSEDDNGRKYENIAIWHSPHISKKWFDDECGKYQFPTGRPCFTKVYKVVPFKNDSGKQFIYVIFEHNELSSLGPGLYCGIACGACAGIALFAQKQDKWVLTNFSLCVGSYGNHRRLTAGPKVIKLGADNYGLELVSGVNGPGGPSFASTYLYAPMGDAIVEVYGNNCSAVWDFNGRCSSWHTSLIPQKGDATFNDLHAVIDGDFCTPKMAGGVYEDIDTVGHAPDEVFFKTKVADSFGYKITKLYHFDGEKYKWQRTYYKTFAVKPKVSRQ